ncbi:ZIP family metal transporter [Patescibacteria group bacterium]|nr:ZIP family metal transporter [Patescibacteria group bacterium]
MTNMYVIVSVVIVSLLSLLGAVLMVVQRQKLNFMITYALAFSSGVMLGATFFDLLPEAVELLPENAFSWVLIGFVGFFALEKLIAWHHHIEGRHTHEEKPLAYLTLIGDGIHNFVDGAVIAGAYLVSVPLGITTTLAVIAHEIPHELSDFMVLIHGGLSYKKALMYNFASAATAIIGAILVLFVSEQFSLLEQYLVPLAAGNFLYIAASDLIPELLTSRKGVESVRQIVLLIAGLCVVPVVGMLFGHA